MAYSPLNKDWYYSYVEIPNLEKIVKELMVVRSKAINRIRYNPYFFNLMANEAIESSPALMAYLNYLGLADKFFRLLYSENQSNGSPVHVDTYEAKHCMYSLNIPLSNCEDSYTAWFTTNNNILRQTIQSPTMFAAAGDDDILTEVCRVETIKPMLVNTTVLHRGICSKENRMMVGIRFSPELSSNDLTRLGVKITQ